MDCLNLLAVIPTATTGYSPYTGGLKIKADCCGEECWIGPRQWAIKGSMKTMCPKCLAKFVASERTIPQVINLGNPEKG